MKNNIDAYPKPTICGYCGHKIIFISNAEIYGKEYGNGRCYKCSNCDAYVGVHDGTDIPLGILANKELRNLKKKCHAMFDWYWNRRLNSKAKHKRWQCYNQMALKLGIEPKECHFGWFDKNMLEKSIQILKDGLFAE